MIEKARALFDADGQMGIVLWLQYGMVRHHGEQHLCRMLDVARELVGFIGPWVASIFIDRGRMRCLKYL